MKLPAKWAVFSLILVALAAASSARASEIQASMPDPTFAHKLRCRIATRPAFLDYDFRLHHPMFLNADYRPLQAGKFIRFRIYSRAIKDERGKPFPRPMPVLMEEHTHANDVVNVNRRNEVAFSGTIPTGLGEYEFLATVDNGAGAGCVKRWRSKARLLERDARAHLELAPGEIANTHKALFGPQRDVLKRADGIRACVLLNVEGRIRGRALPDWEAARIAVTALRRVAEDPRVREISTVAFNLEDQNPPRILPFAPRADFAAIGKLYETQEPATVDFQSLGPGREHAFMLSVLEQAKPCMQQANMVLFLTPWWRDSQEFRDSLLQALEPREEQVFAYLRPGRYRPQRGESYGNTWTLQDGLSLAVGKAKGRRITMKSPQQLLDQISNLIEEASKQR